MLVTLSRFVPSGVLVPGSLLTLVTCDDPKLARPAAKSRKKYFNSANKEQTGVATEEAGQLSEAKP